MPAMNSTAHPGQEARREWPTPAEWAVYFVLALLPQSILWLNPTAPPIQYPAGDLAQTLWNHWHFDQAIRAFRNPYFAPEIFHPFGAPLYLHTFEIVDIVLLAPLRWLGGINVAWKAALLGHALWSSAAMHALARRLGLGRLAAMACGIVAAHCSYRYVEARAMSLMTTGHAWFFLWALAGCVQRPGDVRRAALMGLAGVLGVFGNAYYPMFLSVLVPLGGAAAWLFGGWRPDRAWAKGFLRSVAVAAAVAVIPLAFLYAGVLQSRSYLGIGGDPGLKTKIRGGVELIQLVVPNWLRGFVTGEEIPARPWELIAPPARSMSFAPSLLMAAGALAWTLRRGRAQDAPDRPEPGRPYSLAWFAEGASGRPSRAVKAAAVAFLAGSILLSFGPRMKVWTRVDPADVPPRASAPVDWEGISLPSPIQPLWKLPLWSDMRAAKRAAYFWQGGAAFLLAAPFGLMVLAAARRIREGSPVLGAALPAACLAVIFLEASPPYYSAYTGPTHPAYLAIRDHPAPGAVREFPCIGYWLNGSMMYGQTIHGRPIIGGYLSRDPEKFDRWLEERDWCWMIREHFLGGGWDRDPTPEERFRFLQSARADDLRFVIWREEIQPDAMPEGTIRRFIIENGLGAPLPGGDAEMEAFELFIDAIPEELSRPYMPAIGGATGS